MATGGEQAVTSGDFSVLSYRLSADGRHVAMMRGPSPNQSDGDRNEVWTMNAEGGNARALTSNTIEELDPSCRRTTARSFFIAGAGPRFEPYYNQNLFHRTRERRHSDGALPGFSVRVRSRDVGTDGRSILAVVNMGLHSEIFRIDVAGRTCKQLTDGEHSIPSAPAAAWSLEPHAEKLIYLLDEPSRAARRGRCPSPAERRRGSRACATRSPRPTSCPRQERFEWKGRDGVAIEGLLIYPTGYQPGTALSAHRADARRPDGIRQVRRRRRPPDELLPGPRRQGLRRAPTELPAGSAGYGTAFYRDPVGHYFQPHADGHPSRVSTRLIAKAGLPIRIA